jgi:hypothetical protein
LNFSAPQPTHCKHGAWLKSASAPTAQDTDDLSDRCSRLGCHCYKRGPVPAQAEKHALALGLL